jgi:acetoin utilization deacetylase AcuC-like enzyme
MTTLLVHDPSYGDHAVPEGHPERPDRLAAIDAALTSQIFDDLIRQEARKAEARAVQAAHPEDYIEELRTIISAAEDLAALDGDTFFGRAGLETAWRTAGAGCQAVDEVVAGRVSNAFVACRPPGHHAEARRAMGFCLFNNAVIAARHAQRHHGLERIAIVDWDVHHGNGTQALVWNDPSILYTSTHQMPLYPGSGAVSETGVGNIVNAPLSAGDGSLEFRAAFAGPIMAAVQAFSPDLIIISAGFDAHARDPLGGLNFETEDFFWATTQIMDVAENACQGRIVSVLEGGYDLFALADSTASHLVALMSA